MNIDSDLSLENLQPLPFLPWLKIYRFMSLDVEDKDLEWFAGCVDALMEGR